MTGADDCVTAVDGFNEFRGTGKSGAVMRNDQHVAFQIRAGCDELPFDSGGNIPGDEETDVPKSYFYNKRQVINIVRGQAVVIAGNIIRRP